VVGPAGLGKTICNDQIAYELAGTIVVSIDPDTGSASGFLGLLDDALHSKRRGRRRVLLSRLAERLRDSGRLLIVDLAYELADKSLRMVMALHDMCDLPVLLVGTVKLNHRLLDDEDPEFGQISSRIGIRCDLRTIVSPQQGGRARYWVTAAELRKMYSCKLRIHPDAMRMLGRIANWGVGHLRRAKHVLRLAEAIAGRSR
jgi:DNA transposition AAA+ family ATPase